MVIARMKGCQMRIFIISLLLVLLAAISRAEAPDHLDVWDQFQLWTGCQPVVLDVILKKNYTPDIDLTEEEILTAVRSRLRSAKVYNEDGYYPSLFVGVNVYGPAFSININLSKFLVDREFSGITGGAVSWQRGSTGTPTDGTYILSAVSKHIDKFLDEYLRVNADAC